MSEDIANTNTRQSRPLPQRFGIRIDVDYSDERADEDCRTLRIDADAGSVRGHAYGFLGTHIGPSPTETQALAKAAELTNQIALLQQDSARVNEGAAVLSADNKQLRLDAGLWESRARMLREWIERNMLCSDPGAPPRLYSNVLSGKFPATEKGALVDAFDGWAIDYDEDVDLDGD